MNTGLLLRISLRTLQKHKGRSFLTILGIIIGISAIIATLAIGKGAEENMRQQFLAMGNNYVELFSGSILQEGKTKSKKGRQFEWLQLRDVEILEKLCDGIQYLTPSASSKNIIRYKTNNVYAEVKGGNEYLLRILDRKIKMGSFFTASYAERGARVAVIGTSTAKELFKSLNPIGKTIQIEGTSFTVVGVMKKIENFMGINDPNFEILIPIKALKRHIFKSNDPYIHSIIMSAPNKEIIPFLVKNVRKTIRFQKKLKEDEPDTFTVIDQASLLKAAKGVSETIRLLLLIIASISLLVGGIGIMNIMLVSVSERTREIGIRMALGATCRTILLQFLTEAIVLCLIGGILGTALGISIPYAIAKATSWKPIISSSSIIIALSTTSIIGIFFGFYPAKKASRLNPVDALAER